MPKFSMADSKPRIILGLMGFAPEGTTGARLFEVDDLIKALDTFKARGFTELDTAKAYGDGTQEGVTGQAGWCERGFAIGTKVMPLPPWGHKPEQITAAFEESLRHLGTDCIDIAYLHAPDRTVPFADTFAAMDALHRAGRFKRLGLSNFAAFEVAEVVTLCAERGWVRPTVYQGLYNCMQRSIEAELLPACRRYGLEFVAYSPIFGGLFSGQFSSKDEVPAEGRFSDSFFGGYIRKRYFRDALFEAVAEFRSAAEKEGITMIEAALRWILHHSKIDARNGDGIIIGVSRLEHLDQNLDALEKGPLSADILYAMGGVWQKVKGDEPPYWFGELQ